MLSHMANPYTQPYEKYRGMGRVAGPSAQERQQNQQASSTGDILRMLAGAAPMAGSAIGAGIGGVLGAGAGGIGALPGAQLGGMIGGGLGQMAGGMAGAGANRAERPGLERQQERDRQIEMLLQAFGSRR